MIRDVHFSPLMASPAASRHSWSRWQRLVLEAVVALLAFAIWGRLAYVGGIRLLARLEDLPIGGSVLFDALSLFIGVAGSIAGVAAVWALVMRMAGRTPASLLGAPDDSPEDYPQADRSEDYR